MNKDEVIGNWNVFKGKVKEQWSELTDDELLKIEGKKDQLLGTIQKKYGLTKEEAEKQYVNFEKDLCKDKPNTDSCCS